VKEAVDKKSMRCSGCVRGEDVVEEDEVRGERERKREREQTTKLIQSNIAD
jgi:hypothetical protein